MMAYDIDHTADNMNINEQEYANDDELGFTKFDSCIGVVVRKKRLLVGVHLVAVARDHQTHFNNEAVDKVLGIIEKEIGKNHDEAIIFGNTNGWEKDFAEQMTKLKNNIAGVKVYQLGDKAYKVKTDDDGDIEIYE